MTQLQLPSGMEIKGEIKPGYEQILTPDALALVAKLSRTFEPRRQELLAARVARTKELDAGKLPDFLPETRQGEARWILRGNPAATARFDRCSHDLQKPHSHMMATLRQHLPRRAL